MKILRIIARLNVGGPARHVVWLTAGLSKEKFEQLLITGVVPQGEEDMSYFAQHHGITPHIIPEMSRELSPKDAVTLWKIYRLFLKEKPDIIHTHTAKAGTVGRIAGFFYKWLTPKTIIGKPRKVRFVHTFHGHVFHSYYGRAKTRLFLAIEQILACIVTNKIVVLSEQQRKEINEQFKVGKKNQFTVIPLGIDLSVFENSNSRRHIIRDELEVIENEILVGIVGRLTEIKNHSLFLRVAARTIELLMEKNSHEQVRFLVIGDGHLRQKLEKETLELSLNNSILFLGDRNDPENFYPALDIVALTSRNEGTPLTLIEAMANSLPVISTSVGGVVDLLGEKTECNNNGDYVVCERGIRAPSDNVEALAQGLMILIENKPMRLQTGIRGYNFVSTNYSKARLIKDIETLYNELKN